MQLLNLPLINETVLLCNIEKFFAPNRADQMFGLHSYFITFIKALRAHILLC